MSARVCLRTCVSSGSAGIWRWFGPAVFCTQYALPSTCERHWWIDVGRGGMGKAVQASVGALAGPGAEAGLGPLR